ncbi:MAG TPA: ABC transporter substrate-binding protein [Thermoanaerobaculia bacterium]|jgi:branched-chain amino acid transport system substrate-binding protein|nr:ABC transporter substrate-binding protein [Thermoanaerobaculia bacterium]
MILTRRRLDSRGFAAGLALACAISLAGCSGPNTAKTGPIRIGVIAPFNTQPGEGIRNGVKMAVAEINKAGGVNGRALEVVEIDDEYSSEKASQAYQRLAGRDQVAAVLGVASDGIFPIMEQLSRYKVPMITTGAGSDRLTDMVAKDPAKYRWFFRVMHASSELGNVTADFAIRCLAAKHGLKRFAIMVEDDIWTSYVRDIWTKRLSENPGTEVVFSQKFGAETKDFTVLFQQIAAAKADYILDASSRVDATSYLKRWAALNGPPIGAIPTGAGTKRYYDLLGDQGLYVSVVATLPSPENPLTPKSAPWWNAYYPAYGDPAYTSGYSYDAVYIFADAVRRAATTEADALVKSLESTDYTGVSAKWAFEPNHQSKFGEGYREIPIMQYVEPGPRGFKVIWPPSRAARDWQPPKR